MAAPALGSTPSITRDREKASTPTRSAPASGYSAGPSMRSLASSLYSSLPEACSLQAVTIHANIVYSSTTTPATNTGEYVTEPKAMSVTPTAAANGQTLRCAGAWAAAEVFSASVSSPDTVESRV